MKNDLKPCPFCGSNDIGVGFEMPKFGEKLTHFVVCNTCGSRTAKFRSKDKAIEAWNRRHEPRQELEFDYEAEG